MLVAFLGATYFLGSVTYIAIPSKWVIMIWVIFCLASTIKDLKDYEGDIKNNIQTLMTFFGEKKR